MRPKIEHLRISALQQSDNTVYFETLDSIKAEMQQPSSLVGGKNLEVHSIDSFPTLLPPVVRDNGFQAPATPLSNPTALPDPQSVYYYFYPSGP